MRKSAVLKMLVCSALTLGFSAPVMAAANTGTENLQAFNLDNMVVTATRTLKEIQQVPASVSVVTAQEIEEKNITSVRDAISQVPGVFIDRAGDSKNFSMRGFDSSNILVLVDGQQLNDQYKGTVDINDIPVNNIERIEIVRGAASSIYGGHAVGGVISITTKEANEFGTHGSAVVGQGTHNTWKKSLNINTKADEHLSFGVNWERRTSDGFDSRLRTKGNSRYVKTADYKADLEQLSYGKYVYGSRGNRASDHEAYGTYLKWNFDESKSLKYLYDKTKSHQQYNDAYSLVKDKDGNQVFKGTVETQNGDKFAINYYDFYGYINEKEADRHSLQYNDSDNKFSVIASYAKDRFNGYTSDNVPDNYFGLDWTGEGSVSNHPGKYYNMDVVKAWENIGEKHDIVAGLNLKKEEMDQYRGMIPAWRNPHNPAEISAHYQGKVNNSALYVQDEYKASDKFTVYSGLRYDHFKKGEGYFYDEYKATEPWTSNSESYDELSPKLALDFKLDDSTNAYVSYGHSFNAPALYQIYRYSKYRRYEYIANPALDPEKSDTYEIGLKKNWDDKTNLGVTFYKAKTKDKIDTLSFYKDGKIDHKKYVNFAEETRKGVEVNISHDFDEHFSTYVNWSWQEGRESGPKVEGTDATTAYSNVEDYSVPKHIFHAGVQYKQDRLNWLLDYEYVSARQPEQYATGEFGSNDSIILLNTALNYEIGRGFDFQFAVNNLLDRKYFCGDWGEPCAERTFTGTLRYNF